MKLLSVTEAAARAGCLRAYIKAEIKRYQEGKPGLKAERIGNQWTIEETELARWLANPRRGTRGKK